jgi:hypothetical protein
MRELMFAGGAVRPMDAGRGASRLVLWTVAL